MEQPTTPDPHLVAYFLLIYPATNEVLLVDHRKAGLWLPAGGHVKPNEHPKESVKREILEELGVKADFITADPLFLTVTKTAGQPAGHMIFLFGIFLKDVLLFHIHLIQKNLFGFVGSHLTRIPYNQSDPHMKRCIGKLTSLGVLRNAKDEDK